MHGMTQHNILIRHSALKISHNSRVDKRRGFWETLKLSAISTEIAERKAMFIDKLLNVSNYESGRNYRTSQGALHLGKTKDFTSLFLVTAKYRQ